jgi:diacylglycerol kinase (ATP)
MRVLLVLNTKAGGSDPSARGGWAKILSKLGAVHPIQPNEDDVDRGLDAEARESDLVVAAGGDGTIHRIVNAIGRHLDRVQLGVIPMGTGNDFARTLGLPLDAPEEAAEAIVEGVVREVDMCAAGGGGVSRLFVNACIGGFPVDVDEAASPTVKRLLGPLGYVAAGAKAAAKLTRSTVTMDGVTVEDCVAAGVGNGRTCGGGITVWPEASPDDGLVDGCAMAVPNPARAIELAAKVRRGNHLEMDAVETVRAPTVRIESDPPIEFNVDGELVGLTTPADFRVAGRLRVRVPSPAGTGS